MMAEDYVMNKKLRDRAGVAREPHKLEVSGSNPLLATMKANTFS